MMMNQRFKISRGQLVFHSHIHNSMHATETAKWMFFFKKILFYKFFSNNKTIQSDRLTLNFGSQNKWFIKTFAYRWWVMKNVIEKAWISWNRLLCNRFKMYHTTFTSYSFMKNLCAAHNLSKTWRNSKLSIRTKKCYHCIDPSQTSLSEKLRHNKIPNAIIMHNVLQNAYLRTKDAPHKLHCLCHLIWWLHIASWKCVMPYLTYRIKKDSNRSNDNRALHSIHIQYSYCVAGNFWKLSHIW